MYRALLIEFLAELLKATHTADTPDTFHHAVQGFCEELRRWLTPADGPSEPRAVFSLLAECTM